MHSFQTILFERVGHIAIITLNRPEAMNAMSTQMWKETGKALEQFANDPELWVAILTGAGDRAFCVGSDLKQYADGSFVVTEEMAKWGYGGIVQHHMSKPIIAAVNGYALGGGAEIVLSCDLVVASEQAVFGFPEVKHGLIAGAGGLLRLPRQIPMKLAMQAILTGEPFSAVEAERWGLINQITAHDQVLATAMDLAEKIVKNAPVAVRASKEIMYRGLDAPLSFPPLAWEVNSTYLSQVLESDDAKEGPRSFVEKRKPNWSGR